MLKSTHIRLALHSDGLPASGLCGVAATRCQPLRCYSYLPAVPAISYVGSLDMYHFFGVLNVGYMIPPSCKRKAGLAKPGSVHRQSGNAPAANL
jgi:hypothetical protein